AIFLSILACCLAYFILSLLISLNLTFLAIFKSLFSFKFTGSGLFLNFSSTIAIISSCSLFTSLSANFLLCILSCAFLFYSSLLFFLISLALASILALLNVFPIANNIKCIVKVITQTITATVIATQAIKKLPIISNNIVIIINSSIFYF